MGRGKSTASNNHSASGGERTRRVLEERIDTAEWEVDQFGRETLNISGLGKATILPEEEIHGGYTRRVYMLATDFDFTDYYNSVDEAKRNAKYAAEDYVRRKYPFTATRPDGSTWTY